MSFEEKLNRGFVILKNNFIFFLVLCLASALICVAIIPSFVKNNVPEATINQQLSTSFGAVGTISAAEIITAITWLFQFSILSTALLIAIYVVKQAMDKRLFAINKWRDWRFFIYASALPIVEIDIWEKFNMLIGLNYRSDLIANFIVSFVFCILSVIFTSLLFNPELVHEKMDLMINDELDNNANWNDNIDKNP
jgi:hypothetical protein